MIKSGKPDEGVLLSSGTMHCGTDGVPFCSEAWDAISRYIYSTIYINNLAEDIIRDAEAELEEKEKHRKHKMMVNRTLGIGILKNDLIYILLEKDAQKQDKLFQQLRIICIYICHDYSGHFIVMYQKNKCRCIITVLISDWR